MSNVSKMGNKYALFGFNPQMWYVDIGNNEVEVCELEKATIWALHEGETVQDLAVRLKAKYHKQTPVLINAMLVNVEESTKRFVKVLDTRQKRNWTRVRDILKNPDNIKLV